MNHKNLQNLISDALAIEAESAKQAGMLGFMAKCFVQVSLPHSDPGEIKYWKRTNGDFTLVVEPGYFVKNGNPCYVGYPFGVIPRLLLAYVSSEAVKTQSPEIVLGASLAEFLRKIGLGRTGGKNGTITHVKHQAKKLFLAKISGNYESDTGFSQVPLQISKRTTMWWDDKEPNSISKWESNIILSPDFYSLVVNNPVPIDLRAINSLKDSALALDIYEWLTHRMSYLNKKTTIPWVAIQEQFGSNYAETRQGKSLFKKKFELQLSKVKVVYPKLNIDSSSSGLTLLPSPSHVLLGKPC